MCPGAPMNYYFRKQERDWYYCLSCLYNQKKRRQKAKDILVQQQDYLQNDHKTFLQNHGWPKDQEYLKKIHYIPGHSLRVQSEGYFLFHGIGPAAGPGAIKKE